MKRHDGKTPHGKAPRLKLAVRDAGATKLRILAAARLEFADHGYMGARVDRIARTAQANKRLLYYYIGNKEALYLATLERAYADIRTAEQELRLEELGPLAAVERLVRFTWAYFNANPSFVALLNTENLHRARHLKKSLQIPDMNSAVVATVGRILKKGARLGVTRRGAANRRLLLRGSRARRTAHDACHSPEAGAWVSFAVRYSAGAREDLRRLYEYLLERSTTTEGLDLAERAIDTIEAAIENLKHSPFTYRKAGSSPFLRELMISFGHSGYVALYEIEDAAHVTIVAVRHQFEDDYH